jgi:hypothetical protein
MPVPRSQDRRVMARVGVSRPVRSGGRRASRRCPPKRGEFMGGAQPEAPKRVRRDWWRVGSPRSAFFPLGAKGGAAVEIELAGLARGPRWRPTGKENPP